MAAGKVISLVLRVLIAVVFVWAGAVKIYDFKQGGSATPLFAQDVMNYQLTSPDISIIIAVYLPWLEVFTGLALLGPWLRLGALSLCAGMTAVFTVAIGSAWQRGLDITCGCFGRTEGNNATDFPLLIGRDLALLAAILIALWVEVRAEKWRARRESNPQPAV